MSVPAYRWRCLACQAGNAAASEQCAGCGCPARPRMEQIERFGRLAALRADKVFAPADADLTIVEGRARSPVEAACIVLAVLCCWAIVAAVIRLSMAPVTGSGFGARILGGMMIAVAVFAALTSVIVYRSARRMRAQR